jgi:hypothetical protein
MQNNGTNNGGIYSQATGWWAVYFDGTSAELRSQNNTRVVARTWGAEIYGQLNQNGFTNFYGGAYMSGNLGVNTGASYTLDVKGSMRFYNDGFGYGGGSTQLYMATYGAVTQWNGYCYHTAYYSAGNNGGGGDIIFRNGYGTNSQAYIYGTPIFLGGQQDTQVYIGGNLGSNILKLNDDLWFNDPQNGSIQLRNGAGDYWGTLVGYLSDVSRRDMKKDITLFDQTKLESLYQDTKNTNIYSWRYKTEPDYYPLKYGPILDESPQYFAATVDENTMLLKQYVSMLHGALKVAIQKIESLETRVSDLEKNPTQ